MEISRGDLLVIQYERRRILVEAISRSGRRYTGVVADQSRADPETVVEIPFGVESVLANFGREPRANGTAFGVKIEPWLRAREVEPWGRVHYFRTLTDREDKTLRGALRRVGCQIVDLGLSHCLPVEIHVRPPRGRWAGSYRTAGTAERFDTITYHPASIGERADTEYVVWHEDAHRVWFRMMTPRMWAYWIRMYHETVQLGLYEHEQIDALRARYIATGGSIREFRAELEEAEAVLFDDIIDWIVGWHSVSRQNIDTIANTSPETLDTLWPTREIEQQDKEMVISDYAKTKPEEFFAEAWAFVFTGRTVPERITAAVKKTLAAVQNR